MEAEQYDVVIVGGGVAGRAAGIFTARHGLETVLVDAGGSLLRRNAHLENFPGFPAGVNSRLLLELMAEQADRAGCLFHRATVDRVERSGAGFTIETADEDRYESTYVIVATKNAVGFLEPLEAIEIRDRGKTFVETDERGRTGVEGLYAAGRLAGKPHQTVIAAGHGAEVAVTLLEDDDRPFYHDWVAPEGYFTGRGRDVPPGCEEIEPAERHERADRSRTVVRERFSDPHPEEPVQHPSVRSAEEDTQ